MTPGLGFALVAMLCFGAGDYFYKRAAVLGIEARQFIMLQAWVFCPGVTLYAWLTGTLHLHPGMLWGALAGLCSLAAFFNFARSLETGAISTNAPIFRLNFTITAALALVVLGESLTPVKAAALACALVACWLLLAEPGVKRPSAESLTRVLIATVAMGIANLLYKLGLREGATPESMVAAQAWLFSSSATLFAWLRYRHFRTKASVWPYSSVSAVAFAMGFILMLHGLQVGQASVLVPVAQMGFVITAILGAIVFREKLNGRKRLGLVVAAAALALFAGS